VIVVSNADGSIRQVNAPQALADVPIPPTTNGYQINFYYPSQVGSVVGGVYQVSGSPFVSWLVTNPVPNSSTYQLQISESGAPYGLIKQWTYTYSAGTWSLQPLGGAIQQSGT